MADFPALNFFMLSLVSWPDHSNGHFEVLDSFQCFHMKEEDGRSVKDINT